MRRVLYKMLHNVFFQEIGPNFEITATQNVVIGKCIFMCYFVQWINSVALHNGIRLLCTA